jgi:hypothetical protein
VRWFLACVATACSGPAAPREPPRAPPEPGLQCLAKLWSRDVEGDTTSYDFSPDGESIAIATGYPPHLRIASLASGRELRSYVPESGNSISAVMWRGPHVLALHGESGITLFAAASLAPLCNLRYRGDALLTQAGVLADPATFTLLRDGGEPMLFDPVSCGFIPLDDPPAGKELREAVLTTESAAVSRDRRYLVAMTGGHPPKVLDMRTAAEVALPATAVFAPDQHLITYTLNRIQLLDPRTRLPRIRDLVDKSSRLSPRGTHLVELSCTGVRALPCELIVHAVGACK